MKGLHLTPGLGVLQVHATHGLCEQRYLITRNTVASTTPVPLASTDPLQPGVSPAGLPQPELPGLH
jgi:hypothetical protein